MRMCPKFILPEGLESWFCYNLEDKKKKKTPSGVGRKPTEKKCKGSNTRSAGA